MRAFSVERFQSQCQLCERCQQVAYRIVNLSTNSVDKVVDISIARTCPAQEFKLLIDLPKK